MEFDYKADLHPNAAKPELFEQHSVAPMALAISELSIKKWLILDTLL